MVASVHEVTYHNKFAGRDTTAFGEQVFDVVELSMNVACEIARGVDADDVGFFGQDGLDGVAEGSNG